MAAAENGHTATVQALIGTGADFNMQDKNGKTALMLATDWRMTNTVQVLIWAGADLNLQSKSGRTALIVATGQGHAATLESLAGAGADACLQDNVSVRTSNTFFAFVTLVNL
jgi:ankyrin repeat protein